MLLPRQLRPYRRLVWLRMVDWFMVVIMFGVAFLLDLAPAFHRRFSLADPTI
ncbi:hypothetical protein BDF19DRAFT_437503 [Syncephalis fuscata]|nr:hypothetical protein BDF19DRAFT_437503 [Syncephalis fuscata]